MRETLEGQIFRCCRWSFFLGLCGPATAKTCWKLSLINEHVVSLWLRWCQLSVLLPCRIDFRANPCTCVGQQPHKLISSSVGGAAQLWRGVRTFPSSLVLFARSESSPSPSVMALMLWQPISLLLSPALKRQIKSILFYFVMFRKCFHKRRVCCINRFMLSDFITCRLISQRYC